MAEPMTNQPVSSSKPKRPLILRIVTLLLFARVILLIIITAIGVAGILLVNQEGVGLEIQQITVELALAGLTLVMLVAAVGMWLLRPWAWQMNMVILGFYLVVDLWLHYSEQAGLVNDVTLLLNILIVFYLVQKDVRRLFVNQPAGEGAP